MVYIKNIDFTIYGKGGVIEDDFQSLLVQVIY